MCALAFGGCHAAQQTVVRLPIRHSVEDEHLLVLSDVRLGRDHALLQDLFQLRRELADSLQLPAQNRQVVVYVFDTKQAYRRYLTATYPALPPRRAYFVGTPRRLAVYTFWGDRIREDLRHEFTHGVLHASLKHVPLWLDEGLAEYFEVTDTGPERINAEYATRLKTALGNGWRPDIKRLESLELVSNMQRLDYQEAWAWVHLMRHGAPGLQDALLGYLDDLKTGTSADTLSDRLREAAPDLELRFCEHVASLQALSPFSLSMQWPSPHLPELASLSHSPKAWSRLK